MKSTVEQLSPTRVKINVEVPFDELKPNFDRAYKKLAQQVSIPGFRPGKAPARVLESRLGRGVVLEEVVNDAIPTKYMEAVNSEEVSTLGRPDLEVTDMADDVLAFSAEVDVRPKITLPAFGEFSVTVDDVELTDSEVDEQFDQLRARFGTLTGVDRSAASGDFVSIDLSATVDGQEIEEAATSGLSYEIGSGELIEGIDDALIGMNVDESKTFTTTLAAGEYAGREADVTVTVQSIKVRELPEPDDEFAQMASEFDTVEELRSDLRQRMARSKRMEQGVQARDKILDALLESTEVPLPESVVESELETRKEDAAHSFDHDDAAFDHWLAQQGQSREEFDAEQRAEAEKSTRTQLVLDTIADEENVDVSENELTERILYQAQRFGVGPEEYLQRAQQSGQLGSIYADVRRGKALGTVVRAASVTDGSGNELDLEDLFGSGEEDEDEQGGEQPGTVEGETLESGSAGSGSAEGESIEVSPGSPTGDHSDEATGSGAESSGAESSNPESSVSAQRES